MGTIDDYNLEGGWTPGMYARKAAGGAQEWYPGKYVVVSPMERAMTRAISPITSPFQDFSKTIKDNAQVITICIASTALLLALYRFQTGE